MAARKRENAFDLPKLDEYFTTQEQRDDAKLKKIYEIPLEEIDEFPDHPFKVLDDEDMMNLAESVREQGIITPATLRKKEDGRYEILSGHRRKRACELAGLDTSALGSRGDGPGCSSHIHGGQQPAANDDTAQRESFFIQDEAGGYETAGKSEWI